MQARTEVYGTEVLANTVEEDQRVPTSKTIRPSQKFVLVHYFNWDFIEDGHAAPGGEWLPELQTVREMVGANGVAIENNRAKPQALYVGHSQKGGIVIPRGERRMGRYANYCQRIPLKGRGAESYPYCHVLMGVSAVVLRGGRDSKAKRDLDVLYGMRRHTFKAGIVPAMTEEHLNDHLDILEERLARAADMMRRGQLDRDAYTELEQKTRARQEAMRAAFNRQFSDVIDDVEAEVSAAPVLAEAVDELDELPAPRTRSRAKKDA